jgi:peptidoglycan/LPS O-acetylase OafA/YrhL
VSVDPNARRQGEPNLSSTYRGDIQGLRAVAVIAVVLNHVGIRFLGGGFIGVDVFFVLSGFLITGLLVSDHLKYGRIRFVNFYSRRARRILPAAALTLIVTDVAAQVLLNYVRARSAIEDSIWAALFAANIQFERIGADYFASGVPPSPVQHFWSLAVEEQFYLVWPALLAILFLAASWVAIRTNRAGVRTAVIAMALMLTIGASLGWSIIQTQGAPADAYFSTLTRAWELGAGAALALGADAVGRLPMPLKAALSWIGLGGIAFSTVWINGSMPYPGVTATVPVVSTILVIAGGTGRVSPFGAAALLGCAPFRFVGDVSYSYYLWHWPFLVLAAGQSLTPLSITTKLEVVAAAFVVSTVTYFAYENPIRRARAIWGRQGVRALILWPVSIPSVVLIALIGLNSLAAIQLSHEFGRGFSTPSPLQSDCPTVECAAGGAGEVAAAVAAADRGDPLPSPLKPSISGLGFTKSSDWDTMGDCTAYLKTTNKICELGAVNSSTLVVLFGDSHAEMWAPAMRSIAATDQVRLVPFVKGDCVPQRWADKLDAQCSRWYSWAVQKVKVMHPNVVVLAAYAGGRREDWLAGLQSTIMSFATTGIRVILVGDPPPLDVAPTDCLLAPRATMRTCTFPLHQTDVQLATDASTVAASAGADYVDVLPWFCYEQACPTVVGSTITRIDVGHVSRTYALELAPSLEMALKLTGSAAHAPDVANAVAQANAHAPIPSILAPPISQLSSDVGVTLPGNCIVRPLVSDVNDICPLGNPGSPKTLVIFGDSHAEMWLPALIPIAKQAGWRLIPIIKQGCLAAWWRSSTGTEDKTCSAWYAWAASKVNSLRAGVVLIGADDVGDEAAWETSLRGTIVTFKSTGARVVLLGDAPHLPIAPTDCLLSPGATMQTCTFPLSSDFANREVSLQHSSAPITSPTWIGSVLIGSARQSSVTQLRIRMSAMYPEPTQVNFQVR